MGGGKERSEKRVGSGEQERSSVIEWQRRAGLGVGSYLLNEGDLEKRRETGRGWLVVMDDVAIGG